jgi:hypothetical protein
MIIFYILGGWYLASIILAGFWAIYRGKEKRIKMLVARRELIDAMEGRGPKSRETQDSKPVDKSSITR